MKINPADVKDRYFNVLSHGVAFICAANKLYLSDCIVFKQNNCFSGDLLKCTK